MEELDATGLLCPLPVLKLRKRLQSLAPGELLAMQASDRGALADVPHFCQSTGHHLEKIHDDGAVIHFLIRKSLA